MSEKEKFFSSVRARIMALFVAFTGLLAAFGGAFPKLDLPTFDMNVVEPLLNAAAIVVAVFIWSRTQRNTKV